ncbi:hypothetical protein EDC01DRAFT_636930 [Geopyxis carbonaria]|nr:hypothetical protein EDC01DRAFT_636930 [Geopyxis carbonaria]
MSKSSKKLPYVPFDPNRPKPPPVKFPPGPVDAKKTLANLAITHPQQHSVLVSHLREFLAGIDDPKLTDKEKVQRAWEKLNVWLAIKARAKQAAANRARLEFPPPTKRNRFPRPKAIKRVEPGTLGRAGGRVLNWPLLVERERAAKAAYETHKRLVLEGKISPDEVVLPEDTKEDGRVFEGGPVEDDGELVDPEPARLRAQRREANAKKVPYVINEHGFPAPKRDPRSELILHAFPGEVWHGERFRKLEGQEEHDAMAKWCDMQMNTIGL